MKKLLLLSLFVGIAVDWAPALQAGPKEVDACKTNECEVPYKKCHAAAMKITNEKQRNAARLVCADKKVACRKTCDAKHK